MQHYLIIIERAGENYSAFSPDIPGCITTGITVDETLKNMKEAVELYLEESDSLPVSNGLEFYFKQGLLNSRNIGKEYLIANIEIPALHFAS